MSGLSPRILDALERDGEVDLVDEIISALKGLSGAPVALERASALWIWKRAWQAQKPESRRGGDRRSKSFQEKTKVQTLHFDLVASQATGLERRAIYADIALAEALGAEDIKRLWGSPIADNGAALKTVAQFDTYRRGLLFDAWSDDPSLNFRSAMAQAGLREDNDAHAARERLLDMWSRCSSQDRRWFFEQAGFFGIDADAAEAFIASWRKRGRAA